MSERQGHSSPDRRVLRKEDITFNLTSKPLQKVPPVSVVVVYICCCATSGRCWHRTRFGLTAFTTEKHAFDSTNEFNDRHLYRNHGDVYFLSPLRINGKTFGVCQFKPHPIKHQMFFGWEVPLSKISKTFQHDRTISDRVRTTHLGIETFWCPGGE